MKRQTGYDSPWEMIGSAFALVIVARVAIGLVASAAHGGILPLMAVAVVALLALWVVGHRSRSAGTPSVALGLGRLRRWLRPMPRPLGGTVRWGGLLDLWRAGWLGAEGWPIGVYPLCWGLIPIVVRIPSEEQTRGCYLVAPTGMGKSASVNIPIVLSETAIARKEDRHSVVSLDPKTEILRRCREMVRLEDTHAVWVWNPSRPAESTIAFNPLTMIPQRRAPHFQEAIETVANIILAATADSPIATANGMTSDPFWPKMVAGVLKGVLLHLCALHADLSLIDIAEYLAATSPEDMVRHLTTKPHSGAARLRGRVLREMLFNERVRGAVIADLADRTVILTDPRLATLLRAGTLPLFDLDQFLAEPTLLFLQVGGLGDTLTPLLSIVMATIQAQIARRALDGPLPRGVRFLLEEAGIVGRIHHLEHGTAVLRAANVGYLVTVQGRAQLETNYGASRAETIQDNLAHRLVLGGVSDNDARWCCENLGKRVAYRDLASANADGQQSWHYSREEWMLLRPDELRHLRYQMVVDSSMVLPLKLRLRHYAAKH